MQDQAGNTDPMWTKSVYKERLWQTIHDLKERLPIPQLLAEVVALFKEELAKTNIDKDELAIMIFNAAVLICFEPNKLTELALETCHQALRIKPNNPKLLQILAYLYYYVFEESDKAIKIMRQLVEIEPSYENWDFLLYLLKRSKNIKEIEDILYHLSNSNLPEYLRLVAQYYSEIGKYQKAIHILKKALKLQPQHPNIWGV